MIFDHAPQPGPLYWDWRCVVCSEPVSSHAPWWRRLAYRRACPHPTIRPVHGDEIIFLARWRRLACTACGRYLDGGLELANVGPRW